MTCTKTLVLFLLPGTLLSFFPIVAPRHVVLGLLSAYSTFQLEHLFLLLGEHSIPGLMKEESTNVVSMNKKNFQYFLPPAGFLETLLP
jgi:hypothetical protein